MTLTEVELDEIFAELGTPEDGRRLVRQIRGAAAPARRVNPGSAVTGRFPSAKHGTVRTYEGRTTAGLAALLYEADADVREFYDEPVRLEIPAICIGVARSVVHVWPDFLVIRRLTGSTPSWEFAFEEWGTRDRAFRRVREQPTRYERTADGRVRDVLVSEYLSAWGLVYRYCFDSDVPALVGRNEGILRLFRASPRDISPTVRARITAEVRQEHAISLEVLLSRLRGVSVDDVFALIASGEIWTDLARALLTDHTAVRLFASAEIGRLFSNRALPVARTELRLEVGAQFRVSDRNYAIQSLDGDTAFAIADDARVVRFDRTDLVTWIRDGQITGLNDGRKDLAALLLKAGKHLPTALERESVLRSYADAGARPATRTHQRWARAARLGVHQFGSAIAGLVPNIADRGRRGFRTDVKAIALANDAITRLYYGPTQLRVKTVYELYEVMCRDAEGGPLQPVGRTLFYELVRRRPAAKTEGARWGTKAAHAAALRHTASNLPPHGDYANQRMHVDSTRSDLDLVDTATGTPIGRATITLAKDSYSRRIVRALVLLSPPSAKTLQIMFRELVRANRRVPELMVLDLGPEHRNAFVEQVAASYHCELQYRQAGNAPQGGPVESAMDQVQSQLIANLAGGTRANKNVRKKSRKVNSSADAVWTLGALQSLLNEYVAHYNAAPQAVLGGSPDQLWERSLKESGTRAHMEIPYDLSFRALTAFPTARGTLTVSRKGVVVNRLAYWCDALNDPRVQGTAVEVRFEPLDITVAYAHIQGTWHELKLQNDPPALRGVTVAELDSASQVLRRTLGKRRTTPEAIVRLLLDSLAREGDLKAERDAARARLRRAEQRTMLVAERPRPIPTRRRIRRAPPAPRVTTSYALPNDSAAAP